MESANYKESRESSFPAWTFDDNDIWKQEQLQSKVDEYNRLLTYCNELETKLQALDVDSNLNHESQTILSESTKNKLVLLEEYRTLIFLIINILFIIFICVFFYNHPEKEDYPQENSIKLRK